MSKSVGNVVDPLVVIDEIGTDPLRFTLAVGNTPGQVCTLASTGSFGPWLCCDGCSRSRRRTVPKT
eukprot:2036535-Pyramimonas_sp.AAC.1